MRKVLIVDDDTSVRRVISQILALMGYEVMTAANGRDGLDVFRSQSDQIDLVITDLRMPIMNGYEAVHRIRKLKPAARIICMSSYCGQALPPGTLFLPKPFSVAAVQDCVDRALSGVPAAS